MAQKHWHRGSVNPKGLTKEQILEEAQNPELSIKQFSSKQAVMQITDLMGQWCSPEQWSDWAVTPYRPIRGSIRLTSLVETGEFAAENIYFPVECDCTESFDVDEYWKNR